jgi:hypothetical protein
MEIDLVPKNTFCQNLNAIKFFDTRVGFLDNYSFKLPICDYFEQSFSLILRNCNLSDSSIAENAFANIDRKVDLFIEENDLTKLDENTFRPLLQKNSGSKIYLEGNSLICDCLMEWTLEPGTNFIT